MPSVMHIYLSLCSLNSVLDNACGGLWRIRIPMAYSSRNRKNSKNNAESYASGGLLVIGKQGGGNYQYLPVITFMVLTFSITRRP